MVPSRIFTGYHETLLQTSWTAEKKNEKIHSHMLLDFGPIQGISGVAMYFGVNNVA